MSGISYYPEDPTVCHELSAWEDHRGPQLNLLLTPAAEWPPGSGTFL